MPLMHMNQDMYAHGKNALEIAVTIVPQLCIELLKSNLS